MRSSLFIFAFLSTSVFTLAQNQVIKYFDAGQRKIHEEYYVKADDPEKMDGKYKRYFPNGKIAMEGVFANGERSGLFYE